MRLLVLLFAIAAALAAASPVQERHECLTEDVVETLVAAYTRLIQNFTDADANT
jgi:hypothetical protein